MKGTVNEANDPLVALTSEPTRAPYTVPDPATTDVGKLAVGAVTLEPASSAPYTVPDVVTRVVACNTFAPSSSTVIEENEALDARTLVLSSAPNTVPVAALIAPASSSESAPIFGTAREAKDPLVARTCEPISNAPYTVPDPAVIEVSKVALAAVTLTPICKVP